jgi:hypothetical protein
MEENNLLMSVADSVTENVVDFEIDIRPVNGWQALLQKLRIKPKKKVFSIRPLTLYQLQRVAKLLLQIDLKDFTATGVLYLMTHHARMCAEIVAISVTESRQKPSKGLVDLFFYSLAKNEMGTALGIVLQQMNTENFIITITSIRTLNVVEKKRPAVVKSAARNEERPTVPGTLSEAS